MSFMAQLVNQMHATLPPDADFSDQINRFLDLIGMPREERQAYPYVVSSDVLQAPAYFYRWRKVHAAMCIQKAWRAHTAEKRRQLATFVPDVGWRPLEAGRRWQKGAPAATTWRSPAHDRVLERGIRDFLLAQS
jgi:hypothetical protein